MFARAEFEAALADRAAVGVPQPDSRVTSDSARRRLEAAYGIKALDALGTFSRAACLMPQMPFAVPTLT